MPFVVPSVVGQRVRIDPMGPGDLQGVADLDWLRSLHPAMAGWAPMAAAPGTGMLRRPGATDDPVGVLVANDLPGYEGVANVSIFADTDRAPGGLALEGYALFVDALFAQGARIVHHEVLALNGPVRRIMRGLRLPATATYREHAYAAGRWWDVTIHSFDERYWRSLVDRLPRLPVATSHGEPTV